MEGVKEIVTWWWFGECWDGDGCMIVSVYDGWVGISFIHDEFCGKECAAGLTFVDCVVINGAKYIS